MSTSTFPSSAVRLVTLAFVFTGLQACLDLPTPAQRTILTVGDNAFPGFPDGPRADGGSDSFGLLDAALSANDVGNPPECGNGIVEGDEECDEASDTCSADCLRYACGNSRVDPGEICDDGNQSNIDSVSPAAGRLPDECHFTGIGVLPILPLPSSTVFEFSAQHYTR